ncbi:MAG TPA: hypothetical protein VEC01_05575 [Noviherbaspirillum sp.]|uniref:hypothetical protein n=1 Tax=Noviherbaspirillum sp. TaxID=1926288 RepID=UPI002D3CA46C|nr:hypothetical protein [Noviherbaspirillum sp.]HYD94775.1 hypothetical protein [Noviherbaspirillum sp.]
MASSTLDPDNIPEPDRKLGSGHGTSALGPSDISDTGSDVQGARRWAQEADIGLDKGTSEDPDSGPRDRSAGPDIGDAGLDSDTDAVGTGEHGTAGRDSDIEMGADIDVDRIDYIDPADDPNLDLAPDPDDADMPPPRGNDAGRPQQRR